VPNPENKRGGKRREKKGRKRKKGGVWPGRGPARERTPRGGNEKKKKKKNPWLECRTTADSRPFDEKSWEKKRKGEKWPLVSPPGLTRPPDGKGWGGEKMGEKRRLQPFKPLSLPKCRKRKEWRGEKENKKEGEPLACAYPQCAVPVPHPGREKEKEKGKGKRNAASPARLRAYGKQTAGRGGERKGKGNFFKRYLTFASRRASRTERER